MKFHISKIFRRLGVRNRVEAIAQLEALERAGEGRANRAQQT